MKYQIWNGTDTIYTPGVDPEHGRIDYTPDEWKARYPWTNIPGEHCVLAMGTYNGGFCMPLSELVLMANNRGAGIDTTLTAEEQLTAYEEYEDSLNRVDEGAVSNETLTASSLASIAASMEYQNMMTLDDVEEV